MEKVSIIITKLIYYANGQRHTKSEYKSFHSNYNVP